MPPREQGPLAPVRAGIAPGPQHPYGDAQLFYRVPWVFSPQSPGVSKFLEHAEHFPVSGPASARDPSARMPHHLMALLRKAEACFKPLGVLCLVATWGPRSSIVMVSLKASRHQH